METKIVGIIELLVKTTTAINAATDLGTAESLLNQLKEQKIQLGKSFSALKNKGGSLKPAWREEYRKADTLIKLLEQQIDQHRQTQNTKKENVSSPFRLMNSVITEHNDLIRSIDTIEDEYGAEFQELKISLPRIVVIGEESVGKSSLMENIAGVELFPRSEGICTRMPFQLRMQRVSAQRMKQMLPGVPNAESLTIISFEDQPSKFISNPNEVVERVKQITQAKTQGRGVCEHVIVLNVFSQGVMDLTLIDLPGIIVAARPNEPPDIHEQTMRLVTKYASDENTIVLGLISAVGVQMSASHALRVVHLTKAEARSVGVFTKVDRATPKDKVNEKILGTVSDYVPLPEGYIGVINRDLMTEDDVPVDYEITLDESRVRERNFFQEKYPLLLQKGLVGIDALSAKLNKLLGERIKKNWAPKTRDLIFRKSTEVDQALTDLGIDPLGDNPDVPLDRSAFIKQLVGSFVNAFKSRIVAQSDRDLPALIVFSNQIFQASYFEKKMKERIDSGVTAISAIKDSIISEQALELVEACKQGVKAIKDAVKALATRIFQESRFPELIQRFEGLTKLILSELEGFLQQSDRNITMAIEEFGHIEGTCSVYVLVKSTASFAFQTKVAQFVHEMEAECFAMHNRFQIHVTKILHKYLFSELTDSFTVQLLSRVNHLNDTALDSLLREDAQTSKTRTNLKRQLAALEGALSEISKYGAAK